MSYNMVSDQEGFTTPSEDISPMQLDNFIENGRKVLQQLESLTTIWYFTSVRILLTETSSKGQRVLIFQYINESTEVGVSYTTSSSSWAIAPAILTANHVDHENKLSKLLYPLENLLRA